MQPPDDDGDDFEEWELVGVAPDGDPEEEVIEIEPERAAGVARRRLKTHDDWPGPPD
jgi:hypothetical protein